MRAFVTGGSSVLGKHLLAQLRSRGHEATALARDRDVTDLGIFSRLPVDVVFHLASERHQAQGRETYREIDIGGAATLRAAFPHDVHFIYASSIWVYGSSPSTLDESSLLRPLTALGAVKAEVEEIFLRSPRSTILRFGMTYPGGTFGRRLLAPAYQRFFFYPGPGENELGIVSVDDAVSALVLAAERSLLGIYNIVDDEPLRLRRLVEIVHETLGGTRPRPVPAWLVRLALGEDTARLVSANLRVSNEKIKAAGLTLRDRDFASGLARLRERIFE